MGAQAHEVSVLLLAWSKGDQAAREKLIPLVYSQLRQLAYRQMGRERPGHSLQATALVNEAYLRMVNQNDVHCESRAQFFALAAQVMRNILVDYARRRNRIKRGGGGSHVSLDEAMVVSSERAEELVALDEALTNLAAIAPRRSQIVEFRYFGGLSVGETAEVLKISPVTVQREWTTAKAWLYRALEQRSE